MKIDLNTQYVPDMDAFITDDDKQKIREAAEAQYGAFDGLSIGVWVECLHGKFERVLGEITGSWLQRYWVNGFVEYAQSFPKVLENLSPKMDADEERAANGLLQSTLIESVLVFARSYFELPSFKEAEKITLGEILIAKKAVYNETMFRKRLAKIQIANAKNKTR